MYIRAIFDVQDGTRPKDVLKDKYDLPGVWCDVLLLLYVSAPSEAYKVSAGRRVRNRENKVHHGECNILASNSNMRLQGISQVGKT